jgi:hypothetical protein
MNTVKHRFEFLHHLAERCAERCSPPDQNVIVTGVQASRTGQPDKLTQTTPHPVPLHGIADLPGYGKAHPRAAVVGPPPRL